MDRVRDTKPETAEILRDRVRDTQRQRVGDSKQRPHGEKSQT